MDREFIMGKKHKNRESADRNRLQIRLGKWLHLRPQGEQLQQETQFKSVQSRQVSGMRNDADLSDRCRFCERYRGLGIRICWYCGGELND